MQMKNRFTRNALKFFWFRFINAWMSYLLILWTLSLNSDKIPITSEICTYLKLSRITVWNSEKISNFKAHELSWTLIEFCNRILRVPSPCPAIAHIYRWTLWKNHTSVVFSTKKHKTKQKQKKQKRQDKGN